METKKYRRTRANGEGTVYKMPNGKWRAALTIGWEDIKDAETGEARKRRIIRTKSGFRRKTDALAYISELRQEKPDIDLGIKFHEIYNLWSEPHYKRVGKNTENGYRNAYKYCEPLHYRVFTRLKTADLQEVVDACPHGRRTKSDMKSLLTNLYNYAIQNDYCEKNYASFVKLPPKEKSKKDAFTREERNLLWKDYENGNTFTGYILVMIYTGMRYGELAKVKKENVHLDDRYIIGGIKTKAGIDRVIPIADVILPIVTEQYNKTNKKLLEMHEKVFYNEFRATLARLGIRALSPHCCRHTCASALAEAGVQPAIITAIMGHEDYSTTLGYTHISLEKKLAGVNAQFVPPGETE